MLSALVIGDLHLDSSRLNSIFGRKKTLAMQGKVLADAVDLAAGADCVVQLGDVFDSRPSQYALETFLEFAFACEKADKELFVLLGNHDVFNAGDNSLRVVTALLAAEKLRNVHVFTETATVERKGVKMVFLPWPARGPGRSGHVHFGHFAVDGARSESGAVLKDEPLDAPENSHWVLGHVHKRQRVGRATYPGTPYQTKFDQGSEKSIMMARFKRDGRWLMFSRKHMPTKPPWELRDVRVATETELMDAAGTDAGDAALKCRLLYDSKLALPPKFLKENPMFVEAVPVKEPKAAKVELGLPPMDEMSKPGMTFGLDEWLAKSGLTNRQRKAAWRYARQAIAAG